MGLESLLFCEDIQNTADGRPHIIGILDELKPYTIPGYYSFAIFTTIRFEERIVNGRLKVVVSDSSGRKVFETEDMKLPNTGADSLGIKFALNFRNFLFENKGLYEFKVSINGTDIGSRFINVAEMIGGDNND